MVLRARLRQSGIGSRFRLKVKDQSLCAISMWTRWAGVRVEWNPRDAQGGSHQTSWTNGNHLLSAPWKRTAQSNSVLTTKDAMQYPWTTPIPFCVWTIESTHWEMRRFSLHQTWATASGKSKQPKAKRANPHLRLIMDCFSLFVCCLERKRTRHVSACNRRRFIYSP